MIATARGSKARAGCPPVKDLAKAAGICTRTVENDEKKNGAPFRSAKKYLAWRAANRAARSVSAASGGDDFRERKLLAECIKIEAEGRIKELEARVREGELVPRDAVQRWLLSFVTEVRQQIQSWPAELVSELPGDVRLVVDEVATEKVRLLLTRLAAMPEELWGDETVKERHLYT